MDYTARNLSIRPHRFAYSIRFALAAFLAAVLALVAFADSPAQAHATVTVDGEVPVTVSDQGSDEMFNKRAFRQSTIPYAVENRAYYLLTQDAQYAAYGPDDTTSVAYNGAQYDCRIIYLAGGQFNSGGAITAVDGLLSGRPYPAEGVTIFVEGGTFHNINETNYGALSGPNLALVGLTDRTGPNPATFTKAARTGSNPGLERYLVNDPNMRYENLVFDGLGYNMSNAGSRGNYFISISSGDKPFYMNNCTLTNVGLSNTRSAINMVLVNSGQINLENITISNFRVSTSYAYLQLNTGNNINVGKITFEGTLTTAKRFFMDYTTAATVGNVRASDVAVKDALVTDAATDYFAVKSYLFGNVTLPAEYRYAVMGTATSTWTTDSYKVYRSLDAIADNVTYPIYDIVDCSWIVRSGGSYKTVKSQLEGINTILTRTAQAYPVDTTTMALTFGRGWATPAYVKLVVDENGVVPSFEVPAFSDTFTTQTDPTVHIRAVADASVPFAAAIDESTLVPFGKGGAVDIDPSSADKVCFYGIDFHGSEPVETDNPRLTMQEVHSGITSQAIAPVFSNAGDASFAACRFTGLMNDLAITAPELTTGKRTVELKDGPFTATAASSKVYASDGMRIDAGATAFADDPEVVWESSDPAVAAVDPCTGLVTPVAVGTAVIKARSLDTYNQGELDKPETSFVVEVLDAHDPVDPVTPVDPTDPPKPLPGTDQGNGTALVKVGDDALLLPIVLFGAGVVVVLGVLTVTTKRRRQD